MELLITEYRLPIGVLIRILPKSDLFIKLRNCTSTAGLFM